MKLPITIPEDKLQEFERWKSLFIKALMRSGMSVEVLGEAAKYMFTRGMTPMEAMLFTKSMHDALGATREDLPFDEGAEFPYDCRVIKINSEAGDYNSDGAKGVVKGFKVVNETYQLYFVQWDGDLTPMGDPIINGVNAKSLKRDDI